MKTGCTDYFCCLWVISVIGTLSLPRQSISWLLNEMLEIVYWDINEYLVNCIIFVSGIFVY